MFLVLNPVFAVPVTTVSDRAHPRRINDNSKDAQRCLFRQDFDPFSCVLALRGFWRSWLYLAALLNSACFIYTGSNPQILESYIMLCDYNISQVKCQVILIKSKT
jgi:hypothetical protein